MSISDLLPHKTEYLLTTKKEHIKEIHYALGIVPDLLLFIQFCVVL